MYRFRNFIFAMVPVVLAISAWLHVILPAEGDKGWLLHAARKWLEGTPLYTKIFEVNPPLIVWLYAIPAWISMQGNWIKDYQALACLGLVVSGLSAWVGTKLIAFHPAFEGDRIKQIKFGFLQALIFIFYTTQSYFFDREHILIVLAFPYMLRFMPQLAERKIPLWLGITTGCMAAVGFCIKPHAMLIFAALQLFALVRTRSFKSLFNLENYIVAGFTALYMLSIFILTPEYFRVIVPMAYDTYYTFRNEGAGYAYLPPFFIGMGLIFVDFRPWHRTPYRRDVYYLAGICLAFLAYAKINNGWGYTYNPLYCVLTLTAAWMLWEYDWLRREYEERELSSNHIFFGIRGCFIVLMAHAAYMMLYLAIMSHNAEKIISPCDGNPDCWRNSPYEQYFQDHHVQSFGTLSFDFSNWVTLMRLSHTDWNTRFNHLWMLPKLLLEGEAYTKQHYWIVEYVARGFADDLNHKKPDVVLVDSSPGLMGLDRRYDLPKLLSGVPEFKAVWSHYQFMTSFNGCGARYTNSASECKYDLYSRIP
jgi:hypothetical protein